MVCQMYKHPPSVHCRSLTVTISGSRILAKKYDLDTGISRGFSVCTSRSKYSSSVPTNLINYTTFSFNVQSRNKLRL
jgi:hypothetical protein